MAKTLVTGGTGFLGRHLVQRLLDRGDEVRILARAMDPQLAVKGAEFVEGSLLISKDVRKAVEGIEHVYHLAGRVERDNDLAHMMYELHVDGTRRLLDALRDSEALEKIVVASTSGTVGVGPEPEFMAHDDSDTVETVVRDWPYYLSKIYAERVCSRYFREFDLPIVVMRPTLLLGPGDERTSSTGDVVRFLQKKIPTLMTGGLSFVDVRDVADAFVAAMDNAPAGRTFLLGAKNLTIAAFLDDLEFVSGVAGPKTPLPNDAAVAGAKLLDGAMRLFGLRSALDPVTVQMATHYWYIDWSRAERELGFAPRDPMLTLKDTVRWIRRYHPDFEHNLRREPPENMVPSKTTDWAEEQSEKRF